MNEYLFIVRICHYETVHLSTGLSVQVPTGHWQKGHGQKWAKVGNKCSCPPGKSGQKWAKIEMRNINIEKLRKNNKKAKCCQILCFVYSFHYQQENILLPIPFSSRLWCCLTLFKFIKPKMRKCNFIRFLQKKSVLIKFSTKLTLHNIQQ